MYSESVGESYFYNSHGLKLSQKSNYYYFLLGVAAKSGEETKTGYELFLDCDFDKFNPDELVKKAVKTALDKFGGTQCKAGKYPTVLHSDIMSALLSVLFVRTIMYAALRVIYFYLGNLMAFKTLPNVLNYYILFPLVLIAVIAAVTAIVLKKVNSVELWRIRND